MTETSTLLKQAQQMKNHFRAFAGIEEFLTGVQRIESAITGLRVDREKLRDDIEELEDTKTKKGKALAAAAKRSAVKTEEQEKNYALAEAAHRTKLDDTRDRTQKIIKELQATLATAQIKHAAEITRMEEESASMLASVNAAVAERDKLKREVERL